MGLQQDVQKKHEKQREAEAVQYDFWVFVIIVLHDMFTKRFFDQVHKTCQTHFLKNGIGAHIFGIQIN